MADFLIWSDRALEEYEQLLEYLYGGMGNRDNTKSNKRNSPNSNEDSEIS